jgi:hypothetical protein
MEAILHLQEAERVAHESIRYHTIGRELVRELPKRSRKPTPALTAIATRAESASVTDRTLNLVTCGAPLSSRVGDGIRAAHAHGWTPMSSPPTPPCPGPEARTSPMLRF